LRRITNTSVKVVFVLAFLLPVKIFYAQVSDAQVKAMFIYNFLKYIEWPIESSTGNIKICVIGAEDIAGELEVLAAKKKFNNRSIDVTEFNNKDRFHIIVLANNKQDYLNTISKLEHLKNTLIITNEWKSVGKSAAINFLRIDQKVRFDLNITAAKAAQLHISDQLTSLAHSVQQ
jgi:hypothetical protein